LEGWRAYKLGDFPRAESLWAVALRLHPDQVELRISRAQSLALLGRYDSAAAELGVARDTVRVRAVSHASPVLPSLEMFEYAIGIVRVNQGDFPSAREAFGRALTENLAFYWAHARLAGVDLALHDTAAALTELGLAVEIEPNDPALRLYNGYVLRLARRYTEAVAELDVAIRLDPYYAQPHVQLALVAQAEGNSAAATDHYRRFLALAARRDPDRAKVVRALAALAAPPDSRCGKPSRSMRQRSGRLPSYRSVARLDDVHQLGSRPRAGSVDRQGSLEVGHRFSVACDDAGAI